MRIDLNNPDEFTLANVRQLIASGDVTKATQLRVSCHGGAELSLPDDGHASPDVAFQLEPWLPEDRRVGPEAASDDQWVLSVYEALKENWPHPSAQLIGTRQ
ncbi:MAG: hypothetical protein ACWGQW_23815 [bacterium]